MLFYAHSREDSGEDDWQPLHEHLEKVACLARSFAAAFKAGDWGYAAGHVTHPPHGRGSQMALREKEEEWKKTTM